jgi:hypothetical protein
VGRGISALQNLAGGEIAEKGELTAVPAEVVGAETAFKTSFHRYCRGRVFPGYMQSYTGIKKAGH